MRKKEKRYAVRLRESRRTISGTGRGGSTGWFPCSAARSGNSLCLPRETTTFWRRSSRPETNQGTGPPIASSPRFWLFQRLGDLRHGRSEEHTSELQSQSNLVCRLLLEKKKISKQTARLSA